MTVLCRGSNRLIIDEAERSIHDALCVVRSLVKQVRTGRARARALVSPSSPRPEYGSRVLQRYLLPGGAAPEMEVCVKLARYADSVGGQRGFCIRHYAEAFEVIPYTLAENAGMHPISIVTELRKRHAEGEKFAGINMKQNSIADTFELGVIQPLLVTSSTIKLASEQCRALLKIDDIIPTR